MANLHKNHQIAVVDHEVCTYFITDNVVDWSRDDEATTIEREVHCITCGVAVDASIETDSETYQNTLVWNSKNVE